MRRRKPGIIHAIAGSPLRFCGIYIMRWNTGRRTKPVRIGCDFDPAKCRGKSESIHAVYWVVDRKLARRLVKSCAKRLADKATGIHGERVPGKFYIDCTEASALIEQVAADEGITLYSDEILKKLEITPRELELQQLNHDLGPMAGL